MTGLFRRIRLISGLLLLVAAFAFIGHPIAHVDECGHRTDCTLCCKCFSPTLSQTVTTTILAPICEAMRFYPVAEKPVAQILGIGQQQPRSPPPLPAY